MSNRKRPYHPARDPVPVNSRGQLGLPTEERALKSNGFETDVLVAGEIPVVRSREKSILTSPEVRREMIAEAIAELRLKGVFELEGAVIRIKETAADRLLNPAEHEAICWFIRIHAVVEAGRARIVDYQGRPRSQELEKRPYSREEGNARAMHAELCKRLPEPHLAFLDWLAFHEYPGSREGEAPNKIDIGKQIIDSRDARRGEGGLEGFLRAVAQNIAHWRLEIDTISRRQSMVHKEILDNAKKVVVS